MYKEKVNLSEKSKEVNTNDVATAFLKLHLILIDMSDSWMEIVNDLYEIAFKKTFPTISEHEDSLNRMAIEAYERLVEIADYDTLSATLDYYLENKYVLAEYMAWRDDYEKDMNKSNILYYVNILYRFFNGKNEELLKKIQDIKDTLEKIHLHSIRVGRMVGNRLWMQTNEKYFLRTNSSFNIGYVCTPNDFCQEESILGDYVCHADPDHYNLSGYSIIFRDKEEKIEIEIYKYDTKMVDSVYKRLNFMSLYKMEIASTEKNIDAITEMIADKINNFARIEYTRIK